MSDDPSHPELSPEPEVAGGSAEVSPERPPRESKPAGILASDGASSPAPPPPQAAPPSPRPAVAAEPHRALHGSLSALALGALGVVYGDIGTSPLYALKECVHGPHAVAATEANVLGLLSLIFWSVTLVIGVKYLSFVMRADNDGEGGILALLALIPPRKPKSPGRMGALAALVVFGAALLYGDGVITPAISVLSAVEGLGVATHELDRAVIPITIVILLGLFAVQRRGTAAIGSIFGPVMVLWFLTLAGLGLWHIGKNPAVLAALDPRHAVAFFLENGFRGYVVLGSVFLCITGGEALYADMGHFGRRPIQIAWYGFAMPALVLNYFGQGARLTAPGADVAAIAENPFYSLVPAGPAVYPLVAIATAATVIASQALISGAFSLTRQAVQLGYLPRVTVQHTSSEAEGQIYIPEVNAALAAGCIALVLAFRQSSALAAAYGIAVTGTMGITTVAFYVVARERWGWSVGKALPFLLSFLLIDLAFLGANALKFFDGGYVPIVIAGWLFYSMRVWKRGRALLAKYFVSASKPLDEFLSGLAGGSYRSREGKTSKVLRVPGAAVFLTSNTGGTPPLLMHHAQHNRAVHELVMLVTVVNESIPRVRKGKVELEPISDGFFRLRIHVGFMESPNVPHSLAVAKRLYDLPIDLDDVTYYLGRETLLATGAGEMGRREEQLFAFMSRNSQQATKFFKIPPERVVEIGMQVDL